MTSGHRHRCMTEIIPAVATTSIADALDHGIEGGGSVSYFSASCDTQRLTSAIRLHSSPMSTAGARKGAWLKTRTDTVTL